MIDGRIQRQVAWKAAFFAPKLHMAGGKKWVAGRMELEYGTSGTGDGYSTNAGGLDIDDE